MVVRTFISVDFLGTSVFSTADDHGLLMIVSGPPHIHLKSSTSGDKYPMARAL